jgi:hypothetical protein
MLLRRKLLYYENIFLTTLTYNVKAITQINIPLTNKYNIDPVLLYNSLTTSLANSISNNNFITFLLLGSNTFNSSIGQNIMVSNYSISEMKVITNTNYSTLYPTSYPTLKEYNFGNSTKNLSEYKILIILLISITIFISILIIFYTIKYNYIKYLNNSIDLNEISNQN